MIVVAVAPLAARSDDNETLYREAIPDQELPLTTVCVGPGHEPGRGAVVVGAAVVADEEAGAVVVGLVVGLVVVPVGATAPFGRQITLPGWIIVEVDALFSASSEANDTFTRWAIWNHESFRTTV